MNYFSDIGKMRINSRIARFDMRATIKVTYCKFTKQLDNGTRFQAGYREKIHANNRSQGKMRETYKDHQIIDEPFRYKIVDFNYHRSLEDPDERWIDIVLQKGNETRKLRFIRPVKLSIVEGFPECPGLYIADISQNGLEDIKVRVGDFEAGPGGISFWAAEVIDLNN